MSVLVERSMKELNGERKPVYPLFRKGAKPCATPYQQEDLQATFNASIDEGTSNAPSSNATGLSTKKTKKAPKAVVSKAVARSNSSSSSSANVTAGYDRAELLDVDPNSGRRKRRKTEEGKPPAEQSEAQIKYTGQAPQCQPRQRKLPGLDCIPSAQEGVDLDLKANVPAEKRDTSGDKSHQDAIESVKEGQTRCELPNPAGPGVMEASPACTGVSAGLKEAQVKEPASSTHLKDGSPNENIPTNLVETKPRKVLRLNPKTGTIGSPPAKKALPATETIAKQALGQRTQVKSKLVTLRYVPGERLPSGIGLKIEQILNDANSSISLPLQPSRKPQKSSPGKPAKALHPLFLGKAAKNTISQNTSQKDSAIIDLPQSKVYTVLERPRAQSKVGQSTPTKPETTAFSGFGLSAKIMKFPGAVEPAWPWKGMVHVRGFDPNESCQASISTMPLLQSRNRKSKYQAIEVSPAESIVGSLAASLSIEGVAKDIREINPDEYPAVPACLRVPTKYYESGFSIQRRVLEQLHIPPVSTLTPADQSSSEDEVRVSKKSRAPSYPASLSKIYASIANSFSAFDYGQCEIQAWINKYAPKSADDVLQAGTEAQILKSWLQTLTVKSVEAGLGDRSGSRASSLARRSKSSKSEKPVKRKRKPKNVDDFIVSTDEEEDNDMDEITEPEDDISPNGQQDLLKKTVIRAGDAVAMGSKESGKLTNTVVISGPNGCGKTAAVYAVAKELGFEVFEINSSSRRNGKDIIEKVGDMTRNHQVQRTSDSPVDVIDEDKQRIDDALADDLQSGRQGTMNSFFKPKQETKSKAKIKNLVPSKKAAETQASVSKPVAKQQKQSLILIEEVDILYKEDTQFWPTILSLIATSKRPIIMTCNDESAVPITSLTVHAIIRFTPPPVDLAVDYLLLVAASEGHVLRREAVKSLYESRHLDLRASLTDLNFWCQFAVGDVKRGMDWYYPRWSRGKDIDDKGNTLRVVSEGTYETGLGWMSQDYLESDLHHLDIEEEMLHEVYDGWGIDVGDWQRHNPALPLWAERTQALSRGKDDDLAALAMYADFAEAMSSVDLCSGSPFALDNQITLDFTLPKLSQKVKDDYVLAHDLLEATPLVSYDTLNKDICLWMRSRNRKYLQVDQHVYHNFEVPTELARPSEADVIRLITTQATQPGVLLTRKDLSLAFDPVAEPEKLWPLNPTVMELSSFDRTTALITEDLAPYIRSIVAYDARLQQDRAKLSNLLSEGGRPGKRMRTTRAAMSALEGGARKTTRRDRWFTGKVNPYFVMRTGMQSWSDAELVEAKKRAEMMAISVVSSAGEMESGDEHCE